ncbi:MAG: M4 family metallopeptidase [Kaiparowitsia implicata GSE-PSE-MK54-09C]|jgi:Zn-dependent metalloprotease|nr:M4 family metallopeptidase [Kaiparowitsia implicata GSE-PSE-MK54-09C]
MRRRHYCGTGCQCQFIPPNISENLAKKGVEEARVSIQESQQIRARRSLTAMAFNPFTEISAPESASRKIYDCQNQWVQRVDPIARDEGDDPTDKEIVDTVYDYTGAVRDYFKTMLGRNSINDNGMDLVINVHFGVDFMNAFWDGKEMTFGDGDGEIFSNFANSLDVVAHELAHGVTQYTANLEYQSQSGALNEHFSDVFGMAIKQHVNENNAGDADWLIGHEIMGPALYGEALRSMKYPGTAYDNEFLGKDPQPAHMKDYYAGPEDNQGVHINSGIPNRAFYLTALEIGTDQATLIWYHALNKLWPTANFADAVTVIVEQARQLTRDGKAPLGSPQVIRAAFKDVGL